jgi:F-type H+-transporting ATPase subunit b
MNITPSDLLFAVINFLVLVAILSKFLYKPVLNMLETRKEQVRNDLDKAEKAKVEAQQIKDEYAKQMEQAKQEARLIIEKATKVGDETRESLIKETREETARMTEKAKEMIRLEKEQALNQLRDEVATLVVLAAGKVIDKTIDQEAHTKLIRDFIEEVGDALYTRAVYELYDGSTTPIEVMAWTEVFHRMEISCDSCEDVAEVMEGVIMRNS